MRIARVGRIRALVAVLASSMWTGAARAADEPVEVMIVGVVHMANPHLDRHNVTVPDVLLPRHQEEIIRMTEGLGRFKPTQVHVEWDDQPKVDADYAHYLAGGLQSRRDEIVQLAFRLAKNASLAKVHASDTPMSFDFRPLFAFIAKQGRQAELDVLDAKGKAMMEAENEMLRTRGILPLLRMLNRPESILEGHLAHRLVLRYGAGAEQPGPEYWSGWTRRNILICAKIIQAAKPGDRLVAFFGSSHSFQLRQCIGET